MAAERVKSKNLFNFRPAGKIDDDILEMEKTMMPEGVDFEELKVKLKTMTDEEFGDYVKNLMEQMMGAVFNHPTFQEGENSCDQSVLKVATTHDGDYEVKVLVHAPKALASDKSRPCVVYAHGGGAVAGSADMYKGLLSFMAMNCEVVVFNVDYRLAPQTRCPNNVLDFYSVVKYVSSHAAELGVDPRRVAIAGESGGGYICAGAMVQLARQGEAGLVKLAVPIIPMLSDYCFSDPAAMTREEAEQADGQKKIWRLIAGPGFIWPLGWTSPLRGTTTTSLSLVCWRPGWDYFSPISWSVFQQEKHRILVKMEEMSGDALLYPGKADEETLSKMPPAIVWEAEFDFYITEATRFAHKLRSAGRLLELVVIPGTKHGSGMMPAFACHKVESQAFKLAIQEYLVK